MLSLLSSFRCLDVRAGSALAGRFFCFNLDEIDPSEKPADPSQPMFQPVTFWRRLRRGTIWLELPSMRAGRVSQTPNNPFAQGQS